MFKRRETSHSPHFFLQKPLKLNLRRIFFQSGKGNARCCQSEHHRLVSARSGGEKAADHAFSELLVSFSLTHRQFELEALSLQVGTGIGCSDDGDTATIHLTRQPTNSIVQWEWEYTMCIGLLSYHLTMVTFSSFDPQP